MSNLKSQMTMNLTLTISPPTRQVVDRCLLSTRSTTTAAAAIYLIKSLSIIFGKLIQSLILKLLLLLINEEE